MALWDTMSRDHGVATLDELINDGWSARTVQQWVKDNKFLRPHDNVYVSPAAPETLHMRCWIALKAAPGSALSHRTSTFLWDLIDDEPPVEIIVKRGRTPVIPGVIVHQTRDDFVSHRRKGLWVTSPLRSVLDLGAVDRDAVAGAVERGRIANLFTIAALEWQLVEVARQGRRGAGALRAVLDQWALGSARPDGVLEPRFARLRLAHGLPEPEFQYPVGRYRIDFAYPKLMIAIEVDGYEAHGSAVALQRDLERQNHLVALGWTVLRFTWTDVVKRPAMVAKTILDEIGRAERNMLRLAHSNS